MRKSSFVLVAMGLGAVGVFVACSSSNGSGGGGGGGDGGTGSSSGASSGGYSLTNCPNANTGVSSACATCVESSCATQLASINSACASAFDCACPLGVDAGSCFASASAACLAALGSEATCTACTAACGGTTSSSGGSSSSSSSGGSSGTSSSSGGNEDAGCTGVSVTVLNVDSWCTITASGTTPSGTTSSTTSGPSTSICVSDSSTVTLSASANTGFVLGDWHDTKDGGVDPGTDGGDAGAIITTTIGVGSGGTACAWICCPGVGGNPACPTTQANCP